MKRYSPNVDSSECFQGMIEDPNGDYVEFSDLRADKLASAAPEMLEALKRLAAEIEGFGFHKNCAPLRCELKAAQEIITSLQ